MAGLQRSVETFRRSGSSGLVWEDRFLPQELKKKEEEAAAAAAEAAADQPSAAAENGELRRSRSMGSTPSPAVAPGFERNRSNNGHGARGGFRAGGRVSPAIDPPSPKLHGCGFCGVFGKTEQKNKKQKRRR